MVSGQTDGRTRRKTVRLASPRGFCAGVERAVITVEQALAEYGAPVFVRNQIVHNMHVVRRLEAMGAVFVEDLASVAPGRPVIFSAHGAPRSAHIEATSRGLKTIDASCPLVLKVHNEVRRKVAAGRHVILIGHAGHPEVIGTMGQAPSGAVTLVENEEAARRVATPSMPLAFVTQTTLSVDDAAAIINILRRRFSGIEGPNKSDICYATQNRQEAVKLISPGADIVYIVGSQRSSNSNRLVEAAIAAGARSAKLIEDPAQADLAASEAATIIGVSSGASTPETLVEQLLMRLAQNFTIHIETIEHVREAVTFRPPLLKAS